MNAKLKLKSAGFKLTEPRKMVLEYLKDGRHHTAKEIYEGLSKKLGLTTVYRTLELLVELNLVKPLALYDGSVKYEYMLDKSHHHHLICNYCGLICELDGCALYELEKEIGRNTNYQITNHVLELFGVCPKCQSTEGRDI